MSGNKMLIDASHPEETRVAVVRGNRIEDYDFESQEKRQLRGNIYLAKVTRVEPSLQAAFIDYGGNRHGFLAFSEIHPDYYQIPVADRQALLEEEAQQARAHREADEADLEQAASSGDSAEPDGEEEAEEKKPKAKRKPRRKSRTSKKAKTGEEDNSGSDEKSASNEESPEAEASETPTAIDATEAESTDGSADDDSEDTSDDDDGDNSKSIAAAMDTDSISEPLPDDEDGEDEPDNDNSPPARKTRRTTRRKTSSKDEEASASADTESSKEVTDESDDTKRSEDGETGDSSSQDEVEEKPAKRRASRRKSTKSKNESNEDDNGTDKDPVPVNTDDDTEFADEDVESVGQEDAMEEVPERRRSRRQYKIQEVVKRRQVMLVQVVKEERGNKGAALTTYMSLAGRYSVLMPNTARGGGISRKISNTNDRKRLKAIASELDVPEGMGVILRTAGASRTKVEIKRDFEYLMRVWDRVRNLTLSSAAPCLVHEEGSLIKRSIRDLYDKEINEILVTGEDGYNEAREFMGMLIPSHAKNIKLYNQPQSLFSKYGVESYLERMLSPEVTLKSGGYLVMNQTEALVAIDVNSGRATREHSIENTALKTNLEAAEEIARQLRLRDLAGLIVIDFIDMEERRNNRAVEKKLKDCLKNDRARIQLGRISHFGLMEMSRQRIRASVLESTMDVCPHCGGQGHVRTGSAIALHVYRGIEDHVARHNRFNVTVRTTPNIAIQLLNTKRQALSELEESYGLTITIEGDYSIKGQDFVIEKGSAAIGKHQVAEQPNDTQIDDDDDSGRRKRRKRRGKDSSSHKEEVDSSNASEAEDQTASLDNADTNSDDSDSEKPKKRRRGARGGRKNRSKPETDQEATEDSAADQTSSASDPDNESDGEEQSKRRTTRRKSTKKADNKAATGVVKAVADTSETKSKTESGAEASGSEEESDRPNRSRNTRRPRKKKADEAAPNEASDSEASKEGLWGGGTGDFF